MYIQPNALQNLKAMQAGKKRQRHTCCVMQSASIHTEEQRLEYQIEYLPGNVFIT